MKIFAESELRQYQETLLDDMKRLLHSEEKNRLLNVNETEYIEYLVSKYTITPLILNREQVHVSDREGNVRVGHHAFDYDLDRSDIKKRQIVCYHLPYSGDTKLLSLSPSSRICWTTEVNIGNNEISFDIVNWNNDVEAIKREATLILDNLITQAQNSTNEVKQYNSLLRQRVQDVFTARKQEYLKQSSILESLGVPFKKKGQMPETFSIPIKKQKPIIQKPASNSMPYVPEPTLDRETYKQILKICHDAGIEIERHPSIYEDKDEETLRDHFLMILAPHFESVTGETFNKQGKTDILIRHEGANVFVGECKFWKGVKAHHKTIDQLLGYLTWRDSKSAILYFISNKQLEPVLDQIEHMTQEHPCCIKYIGKETHGWYSFQFHLPDDETRGVSITVLCFHFPASQRVNSEDA